MVVCFDEQALQIVLLVDEGIGLGLRVLELDLLRDATYLMNVGIRASLLQYSLLASPPAPDSLSGNGLGEFGQCNNPRSSPALTTEDILPEQLRDLGVVLAD